MGRGGRTVVAAILSTACFGPTVPAAIAAGDEFALGEVIVRFDPGTTSTDRAAVRRDLDAELADRIGGVPRAQVLELHAGQGVAAAAERLEALPGVTYAEPNFRYELAGIPNDPLFGQQAGLDNTGQPIGAEGPGSAGADIDAPVAWDVTTGDASVTIAVVDSGIDLAHPDLAPNLASGFDYSGDNDPDPSPDPALDAADHGTHVAGIAGAVGNNGQGVAGVSWHSRLMPLKVSGPTPEHPEGTILGEDVAQAFSHAASNGAQVVNASLGGPNPSHLIQDAMRQSPGTLFVVAAGNDSWDLESERDWFPCESDAENLICVTSTNHDDAGAWGFANWGTSSVDLAAPGVNVLSTVLSSETGFGGPYGFKTGTSMSVPHVSGVAALLFAQNPGASPTAVRSAILSSVDPLPALMGRTATGGRLDAASALVVETAITKAPKPKTRRAKAKFRFDSPNHEPTGFVCKLDRKKPRPCSDHEKFKVSRGRHNVSVAAIDALGRQDPTPATYGWKLKKPK